jgi:hypothetical protein
MTKNGPAKKNAKTAIALNEGDAALIFQQDGMMHLLFPQDAPRVPFPAQLAIVISMRTRDPEWVAEQMRWAHEMERLGQEPMAAAVPEKERAVSAMEAASHGLH